MSGDSEVVLRRKPSRGSFEKRALRIEPFGHFNRRTLRFCSDSTCRGRTRSSAEMSPTSNANRSSVASPSINDATSSCSVVVLQSSRCPKCASPTENTPDPMPFCRASSAPAVRLVARAAAAAAAAAAKKSNRAPAAGGASSQATYQPSEPVR